MVGLCVCLSLGYVREPREPIDMPFGVLIRVGLRYHVLDGAPISPRGRGNF